MLKMKEQKGFTLVELAIVLVIVGLLIGGILKGQELMHNARVTATVAQIKSYEAAVTNFYDMYKEKPGDLVAAETRISECDQCNLTGGEVGNGKVGIRNWTIVGRQTYSITTAAANAATPATWPTCTDAYTAAPTSPTLVCAETTLFWYHLLKTGLISGVTGEGITLQDVPNDITVGGAVPTTSIGGGLWVGNASGAGATLASLGKNTTDGLGIRGTILVTVASAMQVPSVTAGLQMLYPKDAANIDRKLDDGLPNSGNVESYGGIQTHGTGDPAHIADEGVCSSDGSSSGIYAENVNSKDCGLIIRIFK